jgi:hypothetical protein
VRDSAGNQASFAATAPADKAGPVPVSAVDTNGATDGKMETGDTFVATFSEAIAPASMPSSTPITEDAVGGGAVTFAIAGITNGAHSLGTANYVTGAVTVVFAGASVLSAGNTTITITVGACSASCGAEKAGTGMTLIYAPATTLLDAAGNAAAGSTPAAFRVF